jgi:hypothetical protein
LRDRPRKYQRRRATTFRLDGVVLFWASIGKSNPATSVRGGTAANRSAYWCVASQPQAPTVELWKTSRPQEHLQIASLLWSAFRTQIRNLGMCDRKIRGRHILGRMIRLIMLLAGSVTTLASTLGASEALAAGDAERGRRAGRDDAYLRDFLEGDHFPMTMYRLFEQEKEDVLEYFRSLRTTSPARTNPRHPSPLPGVDASRYSASGSRFHNI